MEAFDVAAAEFQRKSAEHLMRQNAAQHIVRLWKENPGWILPDQLQAALFSLEASLP